MKYFFDLTSIKGMRMSMFHSLFLMAFCLLVNTFVSAQTKSQFAKIDDRITYVITIPYSDKAIGLPGRSKNPNIQIHQWDRNDGLSQQFTFEKADQDYYFIRNRHSGLVLEVAGQSKGDDAAIIQQHKHGGISQQFGLIKTAPDTYLIMNRNSRKVLDVGSESMANGGEIIQDANCRRRNQIFKLVMLPPSPCGGKWATIAQEGEMFHFKGQSKAVVRYGANGKYVSKSIVSGGKCNNATFGDPAPGIRKTCSVCKTNKSRFAQIDDRITYIITIPYSDKAIGLPGRSKNPNIQIHQWDRNDGLSQQFTFEKAENGYYFIQNRHSGLFLEVAGQSKRDDAAITQQYKHGRASQQFGLIKTAPDTYLIMNRNSGKVLDVVGESMVNGGKIIQDTNCRRRNQLFKLERLVAPCNGYWSPIAREGETLQFHGTQTVHYGAEGKFVTKSVPSGTKCNNATFGDPAPGIPKECSTCAFQIHYDGSSLSSESK